MGSSQRAVGGGLIAETGITILNISTQHILLSLVGDGLIVLTAMQVKDQGVIEDHGLLTV